MNEEASADRRLGEVPGWANLIALLVTCTIPFRFLVLSVFSLCFRFPSFPQLYLVACTWNSVCVRPVCINARGLRETSSRLGLHNNARCVNLRHDLVCITMPVA